MNRKASRQITVQRKTSRQQAEHARLHSGLPQPGKRGPLSAACCQPSRVKQRYSPPRNVLEGVDRVFNGHCLVAGQREEGG